MLVQSSINKTNHQNASEDLYSTQVTWTTFVSFWTQTQSLSWKRAVRIFYKISYAVFH